MLVSLPKSLVKHSTIFISGLLTGGLVVTFFVFSSLHAQDGQTHFLQALLEEDTNQVNQLKTQSEHTFQNLTRKIANLQAKAISLDAHMDKLGQVLDVSMQHADHDDSYAAPYHLGQEQADMNLFAAIASLEYRLLQRTQQVHALENLVQARRIHEQTRLEGKPGIVKGWISDYFGTRIDPLTGNKRWHSGVDIASPKGKEVKAVATGVVTFAGERGGYGNLLEISHGDGLVTRYGHNQALLVKEGDIVHKGTPIALVGKTGRATGYHVHFEVREQGRAVDPGRFFPDLSRKT